MIKSWSIPVSSYSSAQPPLRHDANLGQLARYLRLIVLTRDRALLQHKIITHDYFVRAVKRVREILVRLALYGTLRHFTRCLRCTKK